MLVKAATQEPVTVRVTGEEEPATSQLKFSYFVPLLSSKEAKVAWKGNLHSWTDIFIRWHDA